MSDEPTLLGVIITWFPMLLLIGAWLFLCWRLGVFKRISMSQGQYLQMTVSADGKLLQVVFEWIESRLQDRFSLAGLPEVEADLLGTVTAFGIIGNGGHVFWYEGMDGEDTLRVAAGFERMELPEAAEALGDPSRFSPEARRLWLVDSAT